MKKFTAALLAALMILSVVSFASCGNDDAPTKPTGVFRETEIEIPEELTGDNVNFDRFLVIGDTLYILVYSYDMETYMPTYRLVSYDLAAKTFGEILDIPLKQSDENGGSNLNNFTVGEDGTIYYAIENYSYSDGMYNQSIEIVKVRDGETESLNVSLPGDEDYGFYVSNMFAFTDGSLLLSSWDSMRMLTADGKVNPVKFGEDEHVNIENMYSMNGELYISIYSFDGDNYGSRLYPFDPVTGEFGEPMEVKAQHSYNMLFGPGYDYYYNDRNVLWGVDIESGDMTEVVNFINSDINGNDISQIVPISADRFFISTRDRTSSRTRAKLAFIDRVPEDEIVEKKMLRLAVTYASYDLRSSVIAFNKSSDTYRISIDDYSRYNTDDNYNAGIDTLTSDILTGNVPDIFMITTEMPYDVYAARGIFADIYELMDADPDFDRGAYLENVFKAYEYGGQLLSLVPSVYISTFAGKKELVGGIDSWNFDEFITFAESHPEMTMFDYDFDRSTFVELFMLFARDNFIDSETGKCSFDSEEFRSLLEFAKSLPDVSFWETVENQGQEFWQEYENRFKEDRVLLASVSLSDLNHSYKNILNYTIGAEPAFVGFPVSEGNGAILQASTEYAIAADSAFKEGAWQFLRTMISEEKQIPYYNEEYKYWEYPANGIPVLRAAVEKMADIAMTPPEDEGYGGIIIGGGIATLPAIPRVAVAKEAVTVEVAVDVSEETVDFELGEDESDESAEGTTEETVTEDVFVSSDIAIDDVAPEIDFDYNYVDPYAIPLNEQQVEDIMSLIEGTTTVGRYDTDLNDIIKEELDPYFAGQQSIDDTAKHIQNRVTIYINEKR